MNYVPKYTITEKIRSNLQAIEQLKESIRGKRILPEAEAVLPELNRRSIQRRLKKLVDAGYLSLVGATHDAKYILRH